MPNPIVWVAVDMPAHSALGGVLAYEAATALAPGTLVRVPLGRRVVTGVVWPAPNGEAADAPPPEQIKPIHSVLPGLSPLGPAWVQLVQFAASYYQRSVGEVALAHLPAPVRDADEALLQKRLRRWAKKAGVAASAVEPPVPPALMPEQAQALATLAQAGHDKPVLLFGVTGSGKTEVYLRAAQAALAVGHQVLVLVPEINLTPQLEARFSARFPQHRLAVLHSGMASVLRFEHWLAAHEGQADLVLGTRLGVFASMPRLGLIVVDEEHDPSFKQQDGARYSARDLAVYRGKLQGCQVLLGSATPALETWAHAETGRYLRLTLAQRVGAGSLPRLRVLDMSQLPKVAGAPPVLAPRLLQAIEERIARGEQSLLFLNRRGYSPVLHCPACSWKSGCPHCSAFRVFHKVDRSLPPLRLCRARAACLPGLRQPGHRPRGPRHRKAGRAVARTAAQRARGPHRRRHHAPEGQPGNPVGRRACR
jgi:primosomal protein N' (replication factor Y) (superfamily II helicase)